MISVINGTRFDSFGTQVSTTFSNKTVMLLTITYVCMYVHVTVVVPLLGGKLVYYSYKVLRLT